MIKKIKDKQMEILLCEFQLMSKTVLTQLEIIDKLLQDNSISSLYEEMEDNEIIIDRLEMKIREEVVFAIFKFNPVAADLRRIISYQDMTINLERIGDLVLNIGHRLRNEELFSSQYDLSRKMIVKMMSVVKTMCKNAIFAFNNKDSVLAYKTIDEDDSVDELFHQIKEHLIETFGKTSMSKDLLSLVIDMSMIASNLERIGDSATNIAEDTIYLDKGKDIRHENKKTENINC